MVLKTKKLKYPDDLSDALLVRKIVFHEEQGVDPEIDLDGLDDLAEHILAYLDDEPVGTARFRVVSDKIAKIERVASLEKVRGKGIGKEIMRALEERLLELEIEKAVMDAQVHAQEFYEKLGYKSEGEIFEEAGIAHIKMFKDLRK